MTQAPRIVRRLRAELEESRARVRQLEAARGPAAPVLPQPIPSPSPGVMLPGPRQIPGACQGCGLVDEHRLFCPAEARESAVAR